MPLEALSNPAISPSKVDLPDPEEPTIATESPWEILRSMSDSILIVCWLSSTDLCTAWTDRARLLTLAFDPMCGIVLPILTNQQP